MLRHLIRQSYELAGWIHTEQHNATILVADALKYLEDARREQNRRYEYPARLRRTRISMDWEPLLQRRLLEESSALEKLKETSGQIDRGDLLVYYVKAAILHAVKQSSFQVLIAVTKVLHHYGTAEVMNMYNTIAPNRAGTKTDNKYRQYKNSLIQYLADRFRQYGVHITCGGRGEKSIAIDPQPDAFTLEVIEESLRRFTPWNTDDITRASLQRLADFDPSGSGPNEENKLEPQRVHACTCPDCLSILSAFVDSPRQTLTAPAFEFGHSPSSRPEAVPLNDDQITGLVKTVNDHWERCDNIKHQRLIILVDGVKQAEAQLDGVSCRFVSKIKGGQASLRTAGHHLRLDDNKEVIEFVGEDDKVLVRHFLAPGDADFPTPTMTRYHIGAVPLTFTERPSRKGVILELQAGEWPSLLTRTLLAGKQFWDVTAAPLIQNLVLHPRMIVVDIVVFCTLLSCLYFQRATRDGSPRLGIPTNQTVTAKSLESHRNTPIDTFSQSTTVPKPNTGGTEGRTANIRVTPSLASMGPIQQSPNDPVNSVSTDIPNASIPVPPVRLFAGPRGQPTSGESVENYIFKHTTSRGIVLKVLATWAKAPVEDAEDARHIAYILTGIDSIRRRADEIVAKMEGQEDTPAFQAELRQVAEEIHFVCTTEIVPNQKNYNHRKMEMALMRRRSYSALATLGVQAQFDQSFSGLAPLGYRPKNALNCSGRDCQQ
jgi:hypothetical protein